MKKWIKKLGQLSMLMIMAFIICSFGSGDMPGGSDSSSARVTVSDISIGSKDKSGKYTVKITVQASNLASDESIRTIGVNWGTNKYSPSNRDSRSSGNSVTFTTTWHTGSTYYVTPFLKTSKTGGEIEGTTVTKRTP